MRIRKALEGRLRAIRNGRGCADVLVGDSGQLALSELMLVDFEGLDFRVERGLWNAESGRSS